MRNLVIVSFGLVLAGFCFVGNAFAQTAPQFNLGFKALAGQIPDVAGLPLETEHWSADGDSLQRTSTGLMVWRKADNFTAFTNGALSWVNGPLGVQVRPNDQRFDWENPLPSPTPAATIAATPPAPAPTATGAVPTSKPAATPVPSAPLKLNVLKVNAIDGTELDLGTTWVLGEVQNGGASPAYNVVVSARLLSTSGDVVAMGNTMLPYLGPGDTVGYRVDIKAITGSYARADASVSGSGSSFASFGLMSVAGNPMQKDVDPNAGGDAHYYAGDRFHYTGTMTNTGLMGMALGTIYAWFLDDDGNVIWVDWAVSGQGVMAKGDTYDFDLFTPRQHFNLKVAAITRVKFYAFGMKGY